jgi:hypothetical protein
VGQAPGIGLMRVILNEHSNLAWRAIDLPPEPSSSDAALLWNEIYRATAGIARSHYEVKPAMLGDSTAVARRVNNGSIRRCRYVGIP